MLYKTTFQHVRNLALFEHGIQTLRYLSFVEVSKLKANRKNPSDELCSKKRVPEA